VLIAILFAKIKEFYLGLLKEGVFVIVQRLLIMRGQNVKWREVVMVQISRVRMVE